MIKHLHSFVQSLSAWGASRSSQIKSFKEMVKSILLRPWDLLCVTWFLAHIPMTVLLDSHSSKATRLSTAAADTAAPTLTVPPIVVVLSLLQSCHLTCCS